jgi:class 3 adenylate cyclase
MSPILAKFMAKYGGQLEGLMGKAIPAVEAGAEKVAGWAKGVTQRDKLAALLRKFEEAPELAKIATGGVISGAAGVGVGKAIGSKDEEYQQLLSELEELKRGR